MPTLPYDSGRLALLRASAISSSTLPASRSLRATNTITASATGWTKRKSSAVRLKAEDFRLVHPVAEAVMVFVARKDLEAGNVDELIALARQRASRPLA